VNGLTVHGRHTHPITLSQFLLAPQPITVQPFTKTVRYSIHPTVHDIVRQARPLHADPSFSPPLMPHATGPFDVTITKQETTPDAAVARNLLYKEFHGELEAIARGEMLAAFEPLTNAGVYVAIDRVSGTLHGKSGSFLIAHRGIANADGQSLEIVIVEKKHFYTVNYELAPPEAAG
jgi:hypothetical protein